MARKETSSRISSAAARLEAKFPKRGRIEVVAQPLTGFILSDELCSVALLRSLLMALIGQDETPSGKRKAKKRGKGRAA